MIIRSQDRTMILNMDCVANLYVYEIEFGDTKRIAFEIRTDKCVIGIYSTEEKAIKVLDMITGAYCASKATECLMNNTIQYMYDTEPEIADDAIREYKDSQWFQMPQVCEV